MTRERLYGESGFTLIEILIAVAIMSGLLVGLYTAFFSLSTAQVRIESELEQTRQLRRFMDVISTELRSSFYKAGSERTFFEGRLSGLSEHKRSSLGFTWFGYPRISKRARPASELVAVRYYIKEVSRDEDLDEEGSNNAGVLYKTRWNPYEGEMAGYEAEVMENVENFSLSYFDGKEWLSGWDSSTESKLPVAVKIELTLRDEEREQLYSSIVRVSMGVKTFKGGAL